MKKHNTGKVDNQRGEGIKWMNFEEKCAYLRDAYMAITQKYERLTDELKTINHGGKYVLKIVYTNGEEHVQKFNSIHDLFAEAQNMALLFVNQFKFIVKYEVKK